MNLRWFKIAIHDVQSIHDYIAVNNEKAADRILDHIEYSIDLLLDHPFLGRSGQEPHTRELLVPNFPYFIVYRVKKKTIQIIRIMHTSRNWPG